MNTNLIQKWLRDPRFVFEEETGEVLDAAEADAVPVLVPFRYARFHPTNDRPCLGATRGDHIIRRSAHVGGRQHCTVVCSGLGRRDDAEPPPLKWSAPIVRKAEDQRWPLRDPSPKRLS